MDDCHCPGMVTLGIVNHWHINVPDPDRETIMDTDRNYDIIQFSPWIRSMDRAQKNFPSIRQMDNCYNGWNIFIHSDFCDLANPGNSCHRTADLRPELDTASDKVIDRNSNRYYSMVVPKKKTCASMVMDHCERGSIAFLKFS